MAIDTTHDKRGQPENAVKASNPRQTRKKRPRRGRWLFVVATLAVVVWLLPTIIAKTPLLPWIVKLATADLHGSVTIKSASLGWFSPVEVQDIDVRDAAGKSMLSVASVTGNRWLAAIACDYTKLGTWTIDRPNLSIVMRDNGTNVEDVLAKYLAPKEKQPATKIAVSIKIVDGAASITDEPTGLVWQVQKLSVNFDMPGGPDGPMSADVATDWTDVRDARGSGKLSAGMKMNPAKSGAPSEANVAITQFPLAMLRPLAARFAPGMIVTGRLSSEIRVAWGGQAANTNGIDAKLALEGFSLSAPAMQGDVLRLAGLQADCQASWQAYRFDIAKSSIQCDFGNAALVGTVPLGGKDGFSLSAIAHQPQAFNGVVDLAKIAQLLPATLHLRPELRIDTGQLQWVLSSRPEQQGAVWHGEIKAANLTATDTTTKRPIAWNNPISVAFDAHDVPNAGPIVDRLLCDADPFLHVEGAGTADNLPAKLTFSLKQLADQLRQFVAMDGVQLAGDGTGNLTWKRSPEQQFDAGANVQLRGFQLQTAATPTPWQEDNVLVYASAKGQTNFDAGTSIQTAGLTVASGVDQLEVKLLGPVKDLHGGGVWPWGIELKGLLQNWPARLAAWVPTGAWQLSGGYVLQADGTASADGVALRLMGFAAQPLILKAGGLNINEPRIDASASGSWDPKSNSLQLTKCELTSSALTAAAAGRIVPTAGKNDAQIEGKINFDLQRLAGMLCPGSNIRIAGRGASSASYHGPFDRVAGSAEATFHLDGATLYGFPLAATDMKATMANGVARIEPVDLPVGGGKLHLAPQLRLSPAPLELSVPKGPLVQKVQIDPAMCASLLQFIAPALAGVTTAQGTFSIDLDECCVPLDDLNKANVTGRFTVHNIVIGPGPMIRELAVFMSRESPAQLKRESVVPFQMVNGRVYHKDLELIFPDITIRSSGWVDVSHQTMEFLLQMPVPPKWQAGNSMLSQAARNQTLSIPLHGTLAKPALDPKVVADLTRQFAQKAVGNVIEGQLNRLLTPRK